MIDAPPESDGSASNLIERLRVPECYPHPVKRVHVLETHISWVVLAGRYAYKLKKPVDLGFLDFTDAARRKFYCEEEIRLNRRLAPRLYLDVVPIGEVAGHLRISALPAIEYAVRMRRFASSRLMLHLLECGQVTPEHIDRLAAVIAEFHEKLHSADSISGYGTPAAILAPVEQNFSQLKALLSAADHHLTTILQQASLDEFRRCIPWFQARHEQGRIRECHGDLHLDNIVLLRGVPTPFDGIEFNPEFRWIDVMSETAFLVMDLTSHNRLDLAWRFINAYLEYTGDYGGMRVLRFYLAYRATVRAKINAIRAGQAGLGSTEKTEAMTQCRAYLHQALSHLSQSHPALLLMHGLPGCGKTSVAQQLLERLPAVRVRSDVERKRLFGLKPLQASGSGVNDGIYHADATERTYRRLLEVAEAVLWAGYPVIVDAAFLRASERRQFRALAESMQVPFAVLAVETPEALLRQRIQARQATAHDASEADLAVLEKLIAAQEPLAPSEREQVIKIRNEGTVENCLDQAFWQRLGVLTGLAPS